MSINDFINNIIIKIEIDIAFINHIIEIELMNGIQNSEKTETIEII